MRNMVVAQERRDQASEKIRLIDLSNPLMGILMVFLKETCKMGLSC